MVPQDDTLDVELTVVENLLVYGRYFGLPRRVIRERTAALLDFVQLADRAGDKVEPLSGGLRRRLTIARSLINEPEILILDEPTTGLDPQARHVVWDRLFRLKQRGVTLILTTHYMDEAEQLCDRLVVMDHGRFAAEGSPRDLITRYCSPEVLELRFDPELHQLAADKLKDFPAERAEPGSTRQPSGEVGGWAVTVTTETSFAYMFRFGMMPLMLFCLLACVTPLWYGVNLCRMLSLGHLDPPVALANVAYLAALTAAGIWTGVRTYRRRRARPARRVRHERRDVRLDVQRLLPAEVREAVRRDPGHADAPGAGCAG